MELKNLKINFLGDSITEGCLTSSYDHRFSDVIARETGAICRNYGIGGTRIAKQITPSVCEIYDRYFASRVDEMDADADVVGVFGGTNDFGHGDAPIGQPSDRTPETFYGAMHDLCIKLLEKYPDQFIFFMTPLHRCFEDQLRGDGSKTKDSEPLKTYVDIIREVTEYYAIPVLDLYAMSGIQPKVPVIKEKYTADGLHPNDAGHLVLAKKIVNFIKQN